MIKVLLLNDLSREPARQLVKGISRYANKHGGWQFYQVPPAIRDDRNHISRIVSMVEDLGIDAIFGQWKGIDISVAKKLDIPIILYQREEKILDFPVVRCDNEAVGRMAAGFLTRFENLNLAFCGFEGVVWSDERLQSFREQVGERMVGELLVRDDADEWLTVSNWLKTLPKPVGIFACNDVNAKMLIEVCMSMGLKIPDEVSILGVDDDSFLCNITSSTISTVKLDFEGIGFRVGHDIMESISSKRRDNHVILHEPVRIIERESTPRFAMPDPYVRQVVDFMARHYAEDISISDAIRDIPLSRRSIEQRFRKEYGDRTMLRILTDLRIERMKELLATTDTPVFNIAQMCGFRESTNINRIFRTNTGHSPREYRKIHRDMEK